MIRSGGGSIMVCARVNNLSIQQLFPDPVGPIAIKVNGCCNTTCCCSGNGDGGGGGGDGGGGGGDRLGSCLYFKCLIILSILEKVR